MAVLWVGVVAADEGSVTEAMRQALYAEEVQGDVAGALKAYEAVTARFEEERDLAATALFRQGECLRKLDRPEEAAAVYRRVLSLFPDKERVARLSRENLAALGQPAAPGSAVVPSNPGGAALSEAEQKELAQVRAMAINSPDLLFSADAAGANAFVEAARNGSLAVLDWFLTEQAAGVKPHLGRAAYAAVDAGQLKACERLLAAGASTSGLLVAALRQQRWSVLRLLLASKADVSEVGEVKAEFFSRASGHNSAVANGPILLLALMADAAVPVDVVADLLKAGADPNAEGSWVTDRGAAGRITPLVAAVRKGNGEAVTALLQAKADPNQWVGEPPRTALMVALEQGEWPTVAIVDALVGGGADWKLVATDGWSALHSAAAGGSLSGAQAAITAGVDPNVRTNEGETPLMIAQSRVIGYRAVPALLQAGARIDPADAKLGNAFARACDVWPTDPAVLQAMEALLKAGADARAPWMGDGPPQRPLTGVLQGGWRSGWWPEAVALLLQHGARPDEVDEIFSSLADAIDPSRQTTDSKQRLESHVLPSFRLIWKAAHWRDNQQLTKALWIDEGESTVRDVAAGRLTRDTAPLFVPLFSVDSAVDGVPTLRQLIRQRAIALQLPRRQWNQSSVTRTIDGQETTIPVDVVAVAEGRLEAPALQWGDVLFVPALPEGAEATDDRVRAWALGETRISVRIDLGDAGVVSPPAEAGVPLWEAETVQGPELALASAVRMAGVPADLFGLSVRIHRVGASGTLEELPSTAQSVRHGDVVRVSAPEGAPSLSEDALRSGVWLCRSMDGPFWPVNAGLNTGAEPPLAWVLLALQAPHPGGFQRVDWNRAVLRRWQPKSEEAVAGGEAPAGERWVEEPLLGVWQATKLQPGRILVLPAPDDASQGWPEELKAGLAGLGFDWSLQIDSAASVPRTYKPRLFQRRVVDGRVVWSDEDPEGWRRPVLPITRDLLAMDVAIIGSPPLLSGVDPMQGVQVFPVWAEAGVSVHHSKPPISGPGGNTNSQAQPSNMNLNVPRPGIPVQRRRVVLPPSGN